MNTYIWITAILCIFAISSATAIRCYQCNTHEHPECENLHDYPPHLVSHFYQDCTGDFEGNDPFCRTTITDIKDPELKHNRRVVRSCGFKPSKSACYTTDNGFHHEVVCQCFEDGCNSSANQIVAGTIAALSSIVVLLLR